MKTALSFMLLFALSATQVFAQTEVRPFLLKDDTKGVCNPMLASNNVGPTVMRQDLVARAGASLTATIADCAKRLAREVKMEVDDRPTATEKLALEKETAQRRRDLVAMHLSVNNLERWSEKLDDRSLAARSGAIEIEDIDSALHDELAKEGMRPQVWAALVAGVAFPRQTDGADSPDPTSVALPTSALEFQTKHWGSQRRLHVGLGASVGLQPVTVMKQEVPPTAPGAAPAANPDATPFSAQQTALQMSARIGLNWAATSTQEVTVYYEPGLSALIKPETVSTTEDRRVDAFVVPVDNGQDRLSEAKEFGIEWNLFKDSLVNVHEFKTFTTPQVRVGIGLRTDRRFTAAGALAAFKDPERRTLFRISVDDIPVFDRRTGDLKPANFKVGISLEYERAGWIRKPEGAAVPAGMRLVVQGNLGLLQILGK